jgi:threonyl-tRNA synthetase
MPKCKTVYADCGREEKTDTISIRRHGQEGKGNVTVTIEEFADSERRSKNTKKVFTV